MQVAISSCYLLYVPSSAWIRYYILFKGRFMRRFAQFQPLCMAMYLNCVLQLSIFITEYRWRSEPLALLLQLCEPCNAAQDICFHTGLVR